MTWPQVLQQQLYSTFKRDQIPGLTSENLTECFKCSLVPPSLLTPMQSWWDNKFLLTPFIKMD